MTSMYNTRMFYFCVHKQGWKATVLPSDIIRRGNANCVIKTLDLMIASMSNVWMIIYKLLTS